MFCVVYNMISLVLQHLENLQLDLTAIDPAHRFDVADKIAAMASELRRAATDAPLSTSELFEDERNDVIRTPVRNH